MSARCGKCNGPLVGERNVCLSEACVREMARREDAAGELVDDMPEWVADSYWTLRQMLDGPPEQHSPHAWAEFASLLVRGYEDVVKDFEKVNAVRIAALSTAEREREALQRIVDLVNAEGSIVKPSTLNRGRVVVVDGRTGLDASEATALEAIAALFEEEDGGESPGRLYITHRVPSGGEEGR